MAAHDIVLLCGETGCGKTTQVCSPLSSQTLFPQHPPFLPSSPHTSQAHPKMRTRSRPKCKVYVPLH